MYECKENQHGVEESTQKQESGRSKGMKIVSTRGPFIRIGCLMKTDILNYLV